ncbi:MAG: tRNA pseudouridine(38-40) synthase TruA [Candidatus Eremiobacteraeota bacterium]|nr:tRNA pseudouridine(38-40) synthase TruA [Candidatus Eremiobacteraeota bacterium]
MTFERTLALVIEYDGTGYCGFQRQDGVPSIAERVEHAMSTLCGHTIKITAAGRTDAGVHATGQVVSCTTASPLPLRRTAVALSALLRPDRIAVLRVVEREAGFSARRDALGRTYRYRILNRAAPSPLLAHRVFHVGARLDIEAMRKGAQAFVGDHDFAAFCAAESREKTTRRSVRRIELERDVDLVDMVITADSFVHNMVRIIAGTLIEVGRGRRATGEIATLLASRDRTQAGFTAPAHALYLEKVDYDPPV